MVEYEPKRPSGYSAVQIGLHWAIAALVLFQLVFGESMHEPMRAIRDGVPPSVAETTAASFHIWVGIAVLVLVAVRFVVRLGHGAPPPPSGSPGLQVLAAEVVHWAFYAILFVAPIGGLVAWYVTPAAGDLHALVKPALIVLILLHVAGAVWHQFVGKDKVLRRMFVPTA